MNDTYMIYSVLHAVLSVLWVLLDFVIAGIVIFRFRGTLTTWFIGGGFVFFALARIINSLFNWIVMPRMAGDYMLANVVSNGVFMSLYALTCLVVACGVGLIPRSLRKLAEADVS